MSKAMKWGWGVLAAAALGAGCAGNGIPDQPGVKKRASLEAFSGPQACEQLEKHIEDSAVLDMRTQLTAQRDGNGGGGWGIPIFERGGEATPTNAADSAAGASEKSSPSSYTTTNTQVAGVDEADFVKNDGNRILVLSGGTLYLSRSWPASELALQGKLAIEGWPSEMFLDEQKRVVVFSSVYNAYGPVMPVGSGGVSGDTRSGADIACAGMTCGYSMGNTVKMTVIDANDVANPKVVQEYYLPGRYANARRIGSSVRLVLSDDLRYPAKVKWYPDYEQGLYEDKSRLAKAYDQLIADNEVAIRAQTLSDWLPASRVVVGGASKPLLFDCTQFHKNSGDVRMGLVTIATLNLAQPESVARTTIVGQAGEIYASPTSLYVANQHWWWWPRPGQVDATYLHKFDITQPNEAVYVASGVVDGHIVNQFSMDEDKGFFRIATTISSRVAEAGNQWGRVETTNRLFVMAENNGVLEVVGKSEELAKGERIFSARFIKDRGFVVTFRQIDPLFTFDLSNPAEPRKVGELKVPGFSTYLHPVDDNHLLAIGTYVPEDQTDWRSRALQLSMFDVSDLANPKQTFVQKVGTSYSFSEAQYDHRAFNYFAEKKLLAIPFYDWSYVYTSGDAYWSSFVSDLRVYSVDAVTGFASKGAVSLKDVYQVSGRNQWMYYWTPMVRRSVMADDFVYAISDAGIRVANLSNLAAPVATVRFPPADVK